MSKYSIPITAGYVVIEVFATSFGYEPLSTRAQPMPPIVNFRAKTQAVRVAFTIAAPIEGRAA
jgi:hypothetical protein